MSTREIELEIKKKEIELRLLKKKLSLLQSQPNKEESLIQMAERYQSEFSKITDEDIDEITHEWDKIIDNWDKK